MTIFARSNPDRASFFQRLMTLACTSNFDDNSAIVASSRIADNATYALNLAE